VDFVIGGPPCQTFSAAGRRAAGVAGTTDRRGTLFQEYVRILKLLQPKGFLFENVYGITGANKGEAWQEIQEAALQDTV
jgi:DNA (cytosine-5)-methyltransferase 1